MFTVCLTGGIGSGKSTVSDLFGAHGIEVVDTDEIARELTAAGQSAVQQIKLRFGASVVNADGSLNRERMREIAFADERSRRDLQDILHPLIRNEVRNRLATASGPYVLVVVPLLVETGGYAFADRVIVVDSKEETRIARVMRRSALTRDQVLSIMKTQASREQRLEAADDVIQNDGDLEHLRAEVARLHAHYLTLAI